jgi:hypothetical protein
VRKTARRAAILLSGCATVKLSGKATEADLKKFAPIGTVKPNMFVYTSLERLGLLQSFSALRT